MSTENNIYRKIFSDNLNYYMQINGKIQDDLVKDLNIKSSTVSSWCTGQKLPRMDKIIMLANYFNIHFSKLIDQRIDNERNQVAHGLNAITYTSSDDSMLPLLGVGDVAYIYLKNTYDSGETILFKLDDKEYIRKIIDKNDTVEFQAMNPYYPTMKYTKEELKKHDFTVIGKVIQVQNKSAFK